MTKSILLACAGGYSTSMLVEKMKKVAKEKNIDVIIDAIAANNIKTMIDQADIVMLGPQLAHAEEDLKKQYEPLVPITTINMMDYGMMDGEKVLNTALNIMN